MLQGLLQRGYYDVAIDYLESLGESPKCPVELKEQIELQIAMVHLEAFSQRKSPLGDDIHLSQAKNALARFLEKSPEHEEAYLANRNLGKLLLEEIRTQTAKILSSDMLESQKESLRNQTEEKLNEAETYFKQAEKLAYNRAKMLRDDPLVKTDPARITKRDAAYMQVLEARIQLAALPRDRAKIYDPDSVEFQQFMEEAALLCGEVAQKYASYTGSLDAKLAEAKSYFDLKQYSKARRLLTELNVLNPSTPQFRAILAEAFPMMLELNLKEPNAENLADSLERVQRWTESTTPSLRNDPFYAKTNLLAGKTYFALAQEKNDNSISAQEYRSLAVHFLHSVAVGSPESQEAIKLLALPTESLVEKNSGDDTTSSEAVQSGPQNEGPLNLSATFTDAKNQAERKFQEFLLAEKMLTETTDANEKTKRETYRNQIAEQTIALLGHALKFDDTLPEKTDENSDEQPSPDLRNAMRVKLATLFWSLNRWEDVIVVGDYLMKHYPGTSFGPQGADLSMKAARRLFLEEQTVSKRMKTPLDPALLTRIERTYDTIATRWETFPIGQEALSLRIETELDAGSFEQAKKFIETIPEDSDKRSTAELKFGCALWALYVKSLENPEQSDKLDSLLIETRHHLEKGFEGKRKAKEVGLPVDFATVSSLMVLAQIELQTKNPDAAIKCLADPDFGPMTLLDREKTTSDVLPLFRTPDWNVTFKSQVLTVALRAYLDANKYDSVRELLEHLDSAFAESTPENQERLLGVYVSLGKQLESRWNSLDPNANSKERETLAGGLNMLLERLDTRTSGADDATLLWLADVYYRLGENLTQTMEIESPTPSDKAVSYFEKSETICVTVLERAEPDSAQRAAIRFRIALAQSALGKCGDAYGLLADLIHESEKRLNVQIEAAMTLQRWGKADKDNYIKAIVGDAKKSDGQYEIWGWNGILRRVSPQFEKYKSEYFQASYNKIVCRILLARELQGTDATKMLDGAKNEFQRLQQLHPDFGGGLWKERFQKIREVLR